MYTRTSWSGPTISPNSTVAVSILIGASCAPNCSLTGSAFNFTSSHSYTITVATVNSNQFRFAVFDPNTQEFLTFENVVFTSGTNVTISLRNTGSTSISLVAYYVSDTSNDTYARTSWTAPTITANSTVPVNFLIGSSCPSCTLTGTSFTFTPGYSYTIIIVTARNNIFRFTVTH